MADEVPATATLPAALAYTLGGDQGVRNPELAEKYRGEHKASASKFALDYEDVMSKRQAEVENAKRILDETSAALRAGHTGAGPGQMNLPLLQMAAGFFKPTRSGNFGEEFGNALSGLAGGIGNQRMRDDEFNRGMADLTLKRSSFEQEPLKDRAALLKAQQLQEEKAQQAIETAQMKTAGVDPDKGLPPEAKLYKEALRQHVASGGKQEDFPNLDTWKARREGQIAMERDKGKAVAEAWEALPSLEAKGERFRSEIDKLLSGPNKSVLEGLIGTVRGRQPAWMMNERERDVMAILDTLEALKFGEAVSALKGLGSLSNAEGLKIQGSLGKLDRAGSVEAFIGRLQEMRDSTSKISAEIAKNKVEWGKGYALPKNNTPPAPGGAASPAPTAGGLVQGADGVYRLSPGGR